MMVNRWKDQDIENQQVIKHIIDFQYKSTIKVYIGLLALKFIYLIAFLFQMIADDRKESSENLVFICNVICLLIGVIFFAIEIL